MVAGVRGINFYFMPQLHWRFGYPLILRMMTRAGALSCTANLRRNRWLLSSRGWGGASDCQLLFAACAAPHGAAAAHVGGRQARADPGRAQPGAGAAALRGLVRDGRKPRGWGGRLGHARQLGGLAQRPSRWGPAPARTWAPPSARRPCTATTWSAAGTGPGGRPGWRTLPAFDDARGLGAPRCRLRRRACQPRCRCRGRRRRHRDRSLRAPGRHRQPARPVDRAWLHPYSFTALKVLSAPPIDCPPAEDRFLVEVTFTLGKRFGVPVHAAFSCPDPRTVTMEIVDGAGGLGGGDPRHPAAPRRHGPTAHGRDRGRRGALRPARLRVTHRVAGPLGR